MASIRAFREPYLVTNTEDERDFSDVEARRMRYAIYWSYYENTAFRNLHTWVRKMKQDYGLYRYIRNIYNPAYRLGEFWKMFLMGGTLDPDAGDGVQVPSCLPIATDHDNIRPAIAKTWRWSNWQLQKDIMTLYGPILGDVAVKVIDDTLRKKVYYEVVHPSNITAIDLDGFGNVKGYQIDEMRPDPRGNTGKTVKYTELAEREGPNVLYRTYLDGQKYMWNGVSDEWLVPYTFVPMVVIQHINVGFQWGWSEIHSARPKIQDVEDLASKLHDQIRKVVDAPWMFAGVENPKKKVTTTETAATADNTSPGREEFGALWAPLGASATPLVAPLQIEGVAAEIQNGIAEIERDFPELRFDIWNAGGATSGRALRIARQQPEVKVNQRRGAYDDAMVRLHQMAIAIGGWREYAPEFAPFGLDSFDAGLLDHYIGKRPVFSVDPLDDIEIDAAFYTAVKTAVEAGIPLVQALREGGWDDEKINNMMADPEFQNKLETMRLSTQASQQAIDMANRVANGDSSGSAFGPGGDMMNADEEADAQPA